MIALLLLWFLCNLPVFAHATESELVGRALYLLVRGRLMLITDYIKSIQEK